MSIPFRKNTAKYFETSRQLFVRLTIFENIFLKDLTFL